MGVDSGTTTLYDFLVGVRDTPLHAPSQGRAKEGVCEEDLPPRVPREVGGSPASSCAKRGGWVPCPRGQDKAEVPKSNITCRHN